MKLEEMDFPDTLDAMAKYIFTTKYARFNDELGRRETWEEAVDRVQNMHLRYYDFLVEEDKDKIKWAFDMVRQKYVGPSMRSLQFGGLAIEKNHSKIYNCAVRHIDSIRSFSEIFYLLLSGCGVGIGVSRHFINRLPLLVGPNDKSGTVTTYVIDDSIEGWSDSIEALLSCYFVNTAWSGRKIVFDYSKIRPEGAPLKTSGGKAPGYKGLKAAHIKIKSLLDSMIEQQGLARMRSIDAYDICMHIADAVLSGGVRRSATAAIFDADDELMANAKTGDWWNENPQRARSNNSALIIRDEVTLEHFQEIMQSTKEFGEPGFVFADSKDMLFNPCFTIDQRILTNNGWQTFGELLGTDPVIHQDTRIRGFLEDSREVWKLSEDQTGGKTVQTQAYNVRKTAEQQLIYKLTLSCGRELRATGNHHIATDKGMVELSDLKTGDRVLLGTPSAYHSDKSSNEYKLGLVAGLVAGDGNVPGKCVNVDVWLTDNYQDIEYFETLIADVLRGRSDLNAKGGANISLTPRFNLIETTESYRKYRMSSRALAKVLSEVGFDKYSDLSWIHRLSKEFKAGFISGFYYADGHIEGSASSKTLSMRVTQSNKEALCNIQLVLQELGVMSRLYDLLPEGTSVLPDGRGGVAVYDTKASYRLVINGKDGISRLLNWAWLSYRDNDKLMAFVGKIYGNLDIIDGRQFNRYWSSVVSVVMDGVEDVYCLQEDENRTLIAQGITARRCFEVSFIPVTEDGQCGVQFCNLTTINGSKIDSKDKFLAACEAATIIGTLQAGYTHFPYLNNYAKQLTEQEALLGVSITAMMDNPDILLNPELQNIGAQRVTHINESWASKLGINPAARTTLVKPEGTSTIVFSSMASGIHPAHSRFMFRRVQANKQENVLKFFKSINPELVEGSIYSANGTDDVITFPIRVPDGAMVKTDLTALEHLEIIRSTQQNWVVPGTTKYNTKPIAHNVSCTVICQDDEWEPVGEYLFNNRRHFSAVSLLGATGDKVYAQAPMEAVVTEEDEHKFIELMNAFTPIDYTWMNESEDNTDLQSEGSCYGGACQIITS